MAGGTLAGSQDIPCDWPCAEGIQFVVRVYRNGRWKTKLESNDTERAWDAVTGISRISTKSKFGTTPPS